MRRGAHEGNLLQALACGCCLCCCASFVQVLVILVWFGATVAQPKSDGPGLLFFAISASAFFLGAFSTVQGCKSFWCLLVTLLLLLGSCIFVYGPRYLPSEFSFVRGVYLLAVLKVLLFAAVVLLVLPTKVNLYVIAPVVAAVFLSINANFIIIFWAVLAAWKAGIRRHYLVLYCLLFAPFVIRLYEPHSAIADLPTRALFGWTLAFTVIMGHVLMIVLRWFCIYPTLGYLEATLMLYSLASVIGQLPLATPLNALIWIACCVGALISYDAMIAVHVALHKLQGWKKYAILTLRIISLALFLHATELNSPTWGCIYYFLSVVAGVLILFSINPLFKSTSQLANWPPNSLVVRKSNRKILSYSMLAAHFMVTDSEHVISEYKNWKLPHKAIQTWNYLIWQPYLYFSNNTPNLGRDSYVLIIPIAWLKSAEAFQKGGIAFGATCRSLLQEVITTEGHDLITFFAIDNFVFLAIPFILAVAFVSFLNSAVLLL